MNHEVHRILSSRARRESRRPEAVSLAAAFLLHALAVVLALLLPRLQPPPEQLEFVPVQVIPAAALGVRRPAPPKRKPAEPAAEKPRPAEPEPAAPEPEPEPETPREIAPPPRPVEDDVPVLPRKDEPKKPEPKKPETKKPDPKSTASPRDTRPSTDRTERKPAAPTPGPAGVAPGESGDQLGRRGTAAGSPVGTTAFGSRIGVDNPDFTYGYYLDRLLSLIDAQWQRPNMGEVRAVVHFEIARNGSIIGEVRIVESSGYESFDFSAVRAVQNAASFPPLPRGYRHESLGVNLIVY